MSAACTIGSVGYWRASSGDSGNAFSGCDILPKEGTVDAGVRGIFVRSPLGDFRLDVDDEWRMDGVRSDSRALGSCRAVYRPIDGRWMT